MSQTKEHRFDGCCIYLPTSDFSLKVYNKCRRNWYYMTCIRTAQGDTIEFDCKMIYEDIDFASVTHPLSSKLQAKAYR